MHYGGYVEWRARLRAVGVDSLKGLDVLDVGCGDRAQLALLFASEGARVVGFDNARVAIGIRRPRMWISIARAEGPARLARVVVRDVLHTFRYWVRLQRRSDHRLPFGSVRLVRGDAATLPFADASFDLVVSSAVWEHLPDVARATKEVSRVLRESGIAVIQIALFPALQGGHHAEWHSVEVGPARATRPWDHLYPDRTPLPTYLNEWREGQYREVIDRHLDVFEWQDGAMRGHGFLTDEIVAALPAYTRRDLLLSSLTAWATRRGARQVRRSPTQR
jgi:SAM-dependent methyltransferase